MFVNHNKSVCNKIYDEILLKPLEFENKCITPSKLMLLATSLFFFFFKILFVKIVDVSETAALYFGDVLNGTMKTSKVKRFSQISLCLVYIDSEENTV